MNNPNPTFAESFCALHKIPPENFAQAVFRRSLYRRTLVFTVFLQFFRHDYFAADFDLIHGVEHLRKMREFNAEIDRFNQHPSNRGWLRRRLRLRVSTHRLRLLIKTTLRLPAIPKESATGTSVPFNSADGGINSGR